MKDDFNQHQLRDIEHDLRAAFRRQDPPEGFADRVMARIPAKPPVARWRREWLAMAASACVAVLGAGAWEHHQRQVAGEKAKQELIYALTVASESLHTTRQIIAK